MLSRQSYKPRLRLIGILVIWVSGVGRSYPFIRSLCSFGVVGLTFHTIAIRWSFCTFCTSFLCPSCILLPPPNQFHWSRDANISTDTIKSVARTDGFRGFYRGLGPTILGYLPTWAIYFAVYDGIKRSFGEAPLGSVPSQSQPSANARISPSRPPDTCTSTSPPRPRTPFSSLSTPTSDPSHSRSVRLIPAAQVKGYQPVVREHPWGLHILSAMTAGVCSTVATNPLWVIKTRFMVGVYLRSPIPTSSLRSDDFVSLYSRRSIVDPIAQRTSV